MNKVWMNKMLNVAGSFCLAAGLIFHWDGCCLFFFGEYPFPEE